MKIATWNVNGLRARLELLCHWLEQRRPDLVGLQELKLTDEQFPHEELAAVGYRALVHGQPAWNGVAVLSRGPATLVQRGLPGEEEQGARLLTAELEGLTFTTLYCPNGKHVEHEDFPRKLAWLDALAGYLERRFDAGGRHVVCGDFNLCPQPLDSWDEPALAGTIFHTEEERARYRRLAAWGLDDLFRARHPELRAFSWWDYRGGAFHRGMGLRIDLVLGTGAVVARLREAGIDREFRKKQLGLTPSDHAPVVVDLE